MLLCANKRITNQYQKQFVNIMHSIDIELSSNFGHKNRIKDTYEISLIFGRIAE